MSKWDKWFWRWAMWNRWGGWWRPRARVADAIGRECRIDLEGLGNFAKTLPPARGRPLFWATLPDWFVLMVMVLAVVIALSSVWLVVAKAIKVSGAWEWVTGAVMVSVWLLFFGAAFCVPLVRSRHGRLRCVAACAAAQVCPNCYYDLTGLGAADGAVKCPECGFAWAVLEQRSAPVTVKAQ